MEGGDRVDETIPTPPSRAVIEAVADAEGVSPAELCPPAYDPLHEAIDPDALDALFEDRADGAPRSTGSVSFPYCGYLVTVEEDGSVTLEPLESTDDE
ncbi:HalOD1 output domain-containing protein [Halopiger goleimassiliensis]|uniref:HalOD1 output domain-containing protein n=1 Tax=Halopiger goleimassiliensis TaxID=1293048 RepID=UPI000677D595|nr:HalOD1 output domain-containing protein [Halopiger goleimassiliensis]